jgi:hypothetical protein
MASRYAVFFEPIRPKQWAVVCQVRIAFFWSECWKSFYETEEEAVRNWRQQVQREINERHNTGRRTTDWQP